MAKTRITARALRLAASQVRAAKSAGVTFPAVEEAPDLLRRAKKWLDDHQDWPAVVGGKKEAQWWAIDAAARELEEALKG